MKDKITRCSKYPSVLRTSISTMALLGVAGMAQADSDEGLIQEIEVIGIRSTLEQNLDLKRNSASFLDAITAEDIGKFPDKSVADALQRVPGVSITRDGGEGQFVSVRGISSDLSLTLLNGNYVATASTALDPQRSFNFALLPSSLVSSVEVYKSPQAKIDEGGIGGTIVVNTRKPLDMESGSGFFNVESVYADVSGKSEGSYGGLYSWKNDSGTFGVLASVSTQDRTAVTESVRGENWQLFGGADVEGATWGALATVDGDEISGYMPFAVANVQNVEARDRTGYQLTMQWAPSDRIEATFNYLGAKLSQNTDKLEEVGYQSDFWTSGPSFEGNALYESAITDYEVNNGVITRIHMEDPDQTDGLAQIGTGNVDLEAYGVGGYEFDSESKSDTYDLEVVYSGDFYTATLNAGSTKSDGGLTSGRYQRFHGEDGAVSSWGWDLNGSQILDGPDTSTFNRHDWHQPDQGGTQKDEETYFQVDMNIDRGYGIFTSFDVGMKVRDHDINSANSNMIYDDVDADGNQIDDNADLWGGCCGLGYSYHHLSTLTASGVSDVQGMLQTGSSLTGKAGTGTSGLTGMNWDGYQNWLDAQGFVPWESIYTAIVFDVEEDIKTAYVQGNFESGNISGNLGVRYVETDQEARGYDTLNGVRDDIQDVSTGSSSNVLPSLNVKWDVSDDLVVRASAAKVMARVDYKDLGTASNAFPLPDGMIGQGSDGNPNLKPYAATQYDLGVEWYFAEASLVGATVFQKNIDTFVTSNQYLDTRNYEGLGDVQINITTPINGNDAESNGVELFYQQVFDWGGGVIANYTYTDTSLATVSTGGVTEVPLPGTSKHQYNASAFYETDRYSARVSYNWRDDYAGSVSNGQVLYTDSYGQVDLNGSYSINDSLQLNLSVINLTEETGYVYWGQADRLAERNYAGRRIYVGMNYKF